MSGGADDCARDGGAAPNSTANEVTKIRMLVFIASSLDRDGYTLDVSREAEGWPIVGSNGLTGVFADTERVDAKSSTDRCLHRCCCHLGAVHRQPELSASARPAAGVIEVDNNGRLASWKRTVTPHHRVF